MAELDAIKSRSVVGIDGLIFRRDHAHRRGKVLLPWITPRGDLDHFRSVVKDIIRAAGLRDELSFASFRHGGFTEGADADITDAELRAAGRHTVPHGSFRPTRSVHGSNSSRSLRSGERKERK